MKVLKIISKKMNDIFILIILFFVYFIFVGLTFGLWKIKKNKIGTEDSYWTAGKKIANKDYFLSQY